MDVRELIEDQIEQALQVDTSLVGLRSVLIHIDRAELLLNLATESEDEHFYTDVIYRTNHSYEGILKESFEILTSKSAGNKTPNTIEKEFLSKKILNQRVIELLKNYRQDWRNPSTHDHNLFFTYAEAFLAIMSISSFVHIFLNQIIEKLYYEDEKVAVKKELSKIKKGIVKDYKNLTLFERLKILILAFNRRNISKEEDSNEKFRSRRFGTEILGKIVAYIESIDKKIKIEIEPILKVGTRKIYADLIFSDKKEKVLLELKIARRNRASMGNRQIYEDQLLSYLMHTQITQGILLILPDELEESDEYDINVRSINLNETTIELMIIGLAKENKTESNIQS